MESNLAELTLEFASDPELRSRFLKEPKSVLAEHGIHVPDGMVLEIVEDSATVRHLVLPYFSPGKELTAEEIGQRQSKIII
jgi:nitrile hydratase